MLMIFAVLSVVCFIVGFAFYLGKKPYASLLCSISLGCVALTMMSEFLYAIKLVMNNQMGTFEDVVPYTYKNFIYLVIVAVVLNLIVIVLDNIKHK